MRLPLVLATALAALALAGLANAAPLSSMASFTPSGHTWSCDLLGPTEAAELEFSVTGTAQGLSLLSPYQSSPFTLSGTGRTTSAGPVETLSARLVIQGRDGPVTADLAFPSGVSHTGLCRPWLERLIFSVADAPYTAVWPDGTRERGTYSLGFNTGSFGFTLGLVFHLEELTPPPPPPPSEPTPPALQLPADLTVEATGPGGRTVAFAASAVWPDGRVSAAACAPASGSLFPLGTTTVWCSAGGAEGTFAVTVRDTTPPALTLPTFALLNGTLSLISTDVRLGTTGFFVTWAERATDAVDGSVPVTCDPPSGSELPLGTTVVRCEAVDAAGNRGTLSFAVRLPSLVDAFDQLVTMIETTLGPAAFFLVDDLERLRALLVRAQDSTVPQLLAAVKAQLRAIALQLKSNPFTAVLFQEPIRWIEAQVGVVTVQMWGSLSALVATVAGLIAPCAECASLGSAIDRMAAAVSLGDLADAKSELTLADAALRELQRRADVSGTLLDALTAFLHELRRYVQAIGSSLGGP